MSGYELVRLAEALLLPPTSPLLLSLLGLVLIGRWRRLGRLLCAAGLSALYLAAIPATGVLLAPETEEYPALTDAGLAASGAQAVVVLGGGRYRDAPEYGGVDTVSIPSLRRIRYAAWVQRRSGLPLLVSGGSPRGRPLSEAELMRRVLEEEFGATVQWLEEASTNTQENARNSRAVLAPEGIGRVLLVTDVGHMQRAVESFRQAGFEVVPAPIHFGDRREPGLGLWDWLPRSYGPVRSLLHEWLGRLWYRLRY